MRTISSVFLFSVAVLARTPFWAPVEPPRATYTIVARIDPEKGSIDGSEVIRFRNNTARSIGRLAFDFSGADLTVEGAQRVSGVSSPKLFEFDKEIAPGHSATVAVRFSVSRSPLKEGQGVTLQTWYPRLWWGFATLDDYEVKLSLPEGYTVATSGVLKDGAYRGTNIRAFAVFAGKGFESAEGDAAGVQVRAVFKPEASRCAAILLRTAVDAITFCKERFGFYPHQSLAIVPGGDYPAGGYPIATAMIAVHGQTRMSERQSNWWPWITAHEVGHMYWSEYVFAQGADNMDWLMIGLGIHADREYRRARGIRNAGELWRNYSNGVTQGYDTTMDLTDQQERAVKWDFNNVVVHGKSSAMLNALESVLGREGFDAVYRRCLRDYAGRQFGWRDLQRAAEAQSGENLGWFFDTWVRSSAYAGYKVSGQECSPTFDCSVTVQKTGTLRMPVTIAARFEDGTEQRATTDRLADEEQVQFYAKAALKAVVIDPDTAVAMPKPPAPKPKDIKEEVEELPWTGAGDQALAFYNKMHSLGVSDDALWPKLALLMYDGKHYTEALAAFQDLESFTEPRLKFMGLVWQGHILDLTGKRAEALAKYDAALKVPGDPSMQHGQYNMVINRKWVEERLKEPFTR